MMIFDPEAGVIWMPLSVIGPLAVLWIEPSLSLRCVKQVPARPTATTEPAVTLPVAQPPDAGSGPVVAPVPPGPDPGAEDDEPEPDDLGSVTSHVASVGDVCALPTASIARTAKVCVPFASPARRCGEAQSRSAPPSSRQRNVAPSGSLEWKAIVASVASVEPDGAWSRIAAGGVVSTFQRRVAGGAASGLWPSR